jgi:hypothetical protein
LASSRDAEPQPSSSVELLDDGILEGSRYEGEAEAASSFLLTVS